MRVLAETLVLEGRREIVSEGFRWLLLIPHQHGPSQAVSRHSGGQSLHTVVTFSELEPGALHSFSIVAHVFFLMVVIGAEGDEDAEGGEERGSGRIAQEVQQYLWDLVHGDDFQDEQKDYWSL